MNEITIINIESILIKKISELDDLHDSVILMDKETELTYRFFCSNKTPSISLPVNFAGIPIKITRLKLGIIIINKKNFISYDKN